MHNKKKHTFHKGTVKRLLYYVFKFYKFQFLAVIFFITLSSFVGVSGSYFTGNIIVRLILENMENGVVAMKSDFEAKLAIYVGVMACIFSLGMLAN